MSGRSGRPNKYILFFDSQLLADTIYVGGVKYGVADETATSYLLRGRQRRTIAIDKSEENRTYEIGDVIG